MQKLALHRIEPVIVEVPDRWKRVLDMWAKLLAKPMFNTLTRRKKEPVAQYFCFWEKNKNDEWQFHCEPLEELIRAGYLDDPDLQKSIAEAKAEWKKIKRKREMDDGQ